MESEGEGMNNHLAVLTMASILESCPYDNGKPMLIGEGKLVGNSEYTESQLEAIKRRERSKQRKQQRKEGGE